MKVSFKSFAFELDWQTVAALVVGYGVGQGLREGIGTLCQRAEDPQKALNDMLECVEKTQTQKDHQEEAVEEQQTDDPSFNNN